MSETAVTDLYGSWSDKARGNGLVVVAEGQVTDNGAGALTLLDYVRVFNPLTGSYVLVDSGTYNLGQWGALVVKLPPTAARGAIVTPTVVPWVDADRKLADRDVVVLAVRVDTGAIWWRNGAPLSVVSGAIAPLTVTVAEFLALTPASGLKATVTPYNWTFEYDSGEATAYKWIFLVGAPLEATVPEQWYTGSGSYADGVPSGPVVTVPLAGTYNCHIEALVMFSSGSTRGVIGSHDSGTLFSSSSQSGSAQEFVDNDAVHTFARNATFRERYLRTVGGSAGFQDRHLELAPIKVSQA